MATRTSNPEDEIRVLREQNTELVQKVQHWKMLAAQRENEKLDLKKELNEMGLKLARLRSNGNVQASKLDTALQSASEKALAHLVRASGEIARTIDLAKTYMRERSEMDSISPRWSTIGGTPKTEKIHRVPPMMIGGQSIQPVVSLSRTLLNTSNPRPTARSPNQNRNVTERAMPMAMHMLQDVYIPLTRIDANELHAQNMDTEAEANNSDDSAEGLDVSEGSERSEIEESQRMSDDDYNSSRRLDAVAEDIEPEDEGTPPSRNSRAENPLEGPSWLLDALGTSSHKTASASRSNLEPDSTTEVEDVPTTVEVERRNEEPESNKDGGSRTSCVFSPTVRRRKRASSPPAGATPRRTDHHAGRAHANRNSERVLKVMVAKMRLDSLSPGAGSPASKRVATELELLDAPSPNGATVAGVIVSEATQNLLEQGASGEPHNVRRRAERRSEDTRRTDLTLDESEKEDSRNRSRQDQSRYGSQESRDSDSGGELNAGGRTRRARNKVSYQEKPLNRKMRR